MKLSNKIAISLTLVAAAGVVLYFSGISKNSRTRRMLSQIADEGYETAQDVLFPGQKIQGRKLVYGPIIPD